VGSTPGTSAPNRRSLLPQEHGAYGQILAPLLTALAIGQPRLAALALSLGAALGFLAHEPALVALGQRGPRALEEDGPRARRLLATLAAGAVTSSAVGLALAPPAARWAALLAGALAGASSLLVYRKLEMTAAAEIAIAIALSSLGLPVALAGGVSLSGGLTCWATWAAAFSSAVGAVQVLLWRARRRAGRDPGPAAALASLAVEGAACLLAAGGILPWAGPVALLPMTAVSAALSVLPVSPRRLKQVGWSIMGASCATLLLLVVGLRRG
jgi:hypothetical protein